MTIAACYVSPEGVVIGADSTTTSYVRQPNGELVEHYFDFGQKIFEVGDSGSIAIATWGLGSFVQTSYRTLIARLADEVIAQPCLSLLDVAYRWSAQFWNEYSGRFVESCQRIAELRAKGDLATPEDWGEIRQTVARLTCGFCVAGHATDRTPEAFQLIVTPEDTGPPQPSPIPIGTPMFWGWSNLMNRLMFGMDDALFTAIMDSGKWSGSVQDMVDIALKNRLSPYIDLPLRDAIDWVYSAIYTTIKAIKFSHFPPVCGGPIELAVITSDRPFRWVRHKGLDAAI